jgi:hypothetical protein
MRDVLEVLVEVRGRDTEAALRAGLAALDAGVRSVIADRKPRATVTQLTPKADITR